MFVKQAALENEDRISYYIIDVRSFLLFFIIRNLMSQGFLGFLVAPLKDFSFLNSGVFSWNANQPSLCIFHIASWELEKQSELSLT
jgi:hypothetical protein